MTYQSNAILSYDLHHDKRDEITIFQEYINSNTSVVFKGFLKPGGKTLVFLYLILLIIIIF